MISDSNVPMAENGSVIADANSTDGRTDGRTNGEPPRPDDIALVPHAENPVDNRVRPVEKILTVRRPWASAIFRPISLDPKSIENRSWPIPERFLGIRIGIHAGLSVDPVGVEQLGPASVLEQDRGKILGTVVVTGCHLERGLACQRQGCASNWWAQFSAVGEKPVYHWELEHPHPFVTPFEARGALGLWTPTSPTVIHRLEIAEIAS